jgi:hypothetical protein
MPAKELTETKLLFNRADLKLSEGLLFIFFKIAQREARDATVPLVDESSKNTHPW